MYPRVSLQNKHKPESLPTQCIASQTLQNRDLIRRTLDTKGPEYLGELALANCRDLARLIQWNHEHGIRFFRVSSVIWPWMGTYDVTTLPQYEEISKTLRFAGDLSRLYGQRITFHPSHFVKLGGEEPGLTAKSSSELEAHSQVFDLMGFEPSPWNKINIHVGGVYGDKELTMGRWAAAYLQLSDRCRARVTGVLERAQAGRRVCVGLCWHFWYDELL